MPLFLLGDKHYYCCVIGVFQGVHFPWKIFSKNTKIQFKTDMFFRSITKQEIVGSFLSIGLDMVDLLGMVTIITIITIMIVTNIMTVLSTVVIMLIMIN